jgi:hypothetical protein
MAKAKKQPEAQKTSAAPAAKKAAKSAPKVSAPAPQIDTALAAQSAASMVANRDRLGGGSGSGDRQESSSFKQLKANLNKPALHGPASFLTSTAPQKKSNLPFTGRKQVGHNQTFGADVNRTGVPRRTGG